MKNIIIFLKYKDVIIFNRATDMYNCSLIQKYDLKHIY